MELVINKRYDCNRADIYLVDNIGDKRIFIGYDGNKVVKNETELHETTKGIKPLLSVPMHMLDMLFKLFGDEANKAGISTENEQLLKGKLFATELHLQDMRDISKHLLKMEK